MWCWVCVCRQLSSSDKDLRREKVMWLQNDSSRLRFGSSELQDHILLVPLYDLSL
jgi:hypothetical protein